jgi:GNAT superfamily N-acetyltransferase
VKKGGGEALRIEALTAQLDRSTFESDVEPFGPYFRMQAGQDARKNMAAPFVLLSDGIVAGYCTLTSTAVQLGELPERTACNLPRYPLMPATLGWFAVDRHHQGNGYGRFLLADTLYRAVRSEIGSFAVSVGVKDEHVRRFYECESSLPFPDQPMKHSGRWRTSSGFSSRNKAGNGIAPVVNDNGPLNARLCSKTKVFR